MRRCGDMGIIGPGCSLRRMLGWLVGVGVGVVVGVIVGTYRPCPPRNVAAGRRSSSRTSPCSYPTPHTADRRRVVICFVFGVGLYAVRYGVSDERVCGCVVVNGC